MTSSQFLELRDRVGLNSGQLAKAFDVNGRTAERWASGEQDAPRAVVMLLLLMDQLKLHPDQLFDLAGRAKEITTTRRGE